MCWGAENVYLWRNDHISYAMNNFPISSLVITLPLTLTEIVLKLKLTIEQDSL